MALYQRETRAKQANQAEKRILNDFGNANVNVQHLEETLLKNNHAEMSKAIEASLRMMHDQFKNAQEEAKKSKGSGSTAEFKALQNSHNFLRALADLSPELKHRMNQAKLLDLNVEDLVRNQALITRYKSFLEETLRAKSHQKWHDDLIEALRQYHLKYAGEVNKQADLLRDSIGNQTDTVKHEFQDLGSASLDAMKSNSVFEAAKRLGHFLDQMYVLWVEAPHADKYWSGAKFWHTATSLKDNAQMQLNNQRYGNVSGAPAGAAPDMGPMAGRPGLGH